jgi:hypothetical protein
LFILGRPAEGIPPYQLTGHPRGCITSLVLRTPYFATGCSDVQGKYGYFSISCYILFYYTLILYYYGIRSNIFEIYLWNLKTHLCVYKINPLQPLRTLCNASTISLRQKLDVEGFLFLNAVICYC